MTSWRPPGSILEAPGLGFGEFWNDIFKILGFLAAEMQELILNFKLKLPSSSFKLKLPIPRTPTSKFGARIHGVGLHTTTVVIVSSSSLNSSMQIQYLECLCFRVLAAMGEVLTEWVAGGVPPRGAFNEIS